MDIYGIGQITAKAIYGVCKKEGLSIDEFCDEIFKNLTSKEIFKDGFIDGIANAKFQDEQHHM